jgi:hypothetical protein
MVLSIVCLGRNDYSGDAEGNRVGNDIDIGKIMYGG